MLVAIQQFQLMLTFRQPKARLLTLFSGISLVVGMTFAALYGLRFFVPAIEAKLPISVMIPSHGVVNSLGFAMPAMIAWMVEKSQEQ